MIPLQVLTNRAMISAIEILQSISLREHALASVQSKLQMEYQAAEAEMKVALDESKAKMDFQDYLKQMENMQNSLLDLQAKKHEKKL